MKYTCPADGHSLKAQRVHVRSGQHAIAYLCDHCGGALLDERAQAVVFSNVLKVDPEATLPGERPSPSGQGSMRLMPLGAIALDVCAQTKSIWFDAGKLVVVSQMVKKGAKQDGAEPAPEIGGPTRGIKLRCVDCGHLRPAEGGAFLDVGSGMICRLCTRRAPSPSGALRYRGATVTIDHQGEGADYRGKIAAALSFESCVSGTLRSPGLIQRLLWMIGLRSAALGRTSLDQSVSVAASEFEPLRALLNVHGVPELLHELTSVAAYFELSIQPRELVLSIRGWTPHPQDRHFPAITRFESIARRLLDRLFSLHIDRGDAIPDEPVDEWAPVAES